MKGKAIPPGGVVIPPDLLESPHFSVHRFSTEAEWLAARGDSLGASEIPSLLGVGWTTREKLIAEKVTGTRRKFDKRTRARMDLGKLSEPLIGAAFAMERGKMPTPCGWTIYRNDAIPGLHATPDFWLVDGVELVEGKATGPDGMREWGDWTGFGGRWVWAAEPPVKVTLQVMAQLAATGASAGWVACLIGTAFHTWPIVRDEDIVRMIAAEVSAAIVEIQTARQRQDGTT